MQGVRKAAQYAHGLDDTLASRMCWSSLVQKQTIRCWLERPGALAHAWQETEAATSFVLGVHALSFRRTSHKRTFSTAMKGWSSACSFPIACVQQHHANGDGKSGACRSVKLYSELCAFWALKGRNTVAWVAGRGVGSQEARSGDSRLVLVSRFVGLSRHNQMRF